MATNRLRLTLVFVYLTPSLCLAWGYDGYRIVWDIHPDTGSPETPGNAR